MRQDNSSTSAPIHLPSLGKRMLVGAGIALVLISAFLLSAGEPNPEWPALWRLRPLIIVPLAGAAGGAFYYFIDRRYRGSWARILADILSLIVYVIGLWLGTVLGLDGTYWN